MTMATEPAIIVDMNTPNSGHAFVPRHGQPNHCLYCMFHERAHPTPDDDPRIIDYVSFGAGSRLFVSFLRWCWADSSKIHTGVELINIVEKPQNYMVEYREYLADPDWH